jgi:hypothetical protein
MANCALRDTIHRVYQGILYFENAIRFHCIQVNIISFTNIRKVLSAIFRYSQDQQMPIRFSCRFVTRNFTQNRVIHLEMWAEVCVCSSVKYGYHCISIHTIHKYLIHFLNISVQSIFQIASKLYVPGKNPLPFKIKYGFHFTDFHSTNFCSTRICEVLRYKTSLTPSKKWGMRMSVRLGASVDRDVMKLIFKKLLHTRQLFVRNS